MLFNWLKEWLNAGSSDKGADFCKLTINMNKISVVTVAITECDIVGHVRFCDLVGTDVTFQLTTLSLIFSFF